MNRHQAASEQAKEAGQIPVWEYLCLSCPNCGGEHLHQSEVELYCRHEDEPAKSARYDALTGESTPISDSGNPSSRRQGIVVEFWCERCPALPRLAIFQHKGNTHFGWRGWAWSERTDDSNSDSPSFGWSTWSSAPPGVLEHPPIWDTVDPDPDSSPD